MKFKKISTKLLAFILPVIIIAMVILSAFSALSSKSIIDNKTSEMMNSSLGEATEEVERQLDSIRTTADVLAISVATGYKEESLAAYEDLISTIVSENDIALGSGIWFEPYVYDENEKYVGPYVYKDGGSLKITYEYSNADYDYHSKPFYTISQGLHEPVITDPYYDAPSGNTLSSCSVAIYDKDKYIGCASVGISLETIVDIVNRIKVGENGTGMLMTSSGTYLAGVDADKIANEQKITDESNASLVAAGQTILGSESGITSYVGEKGETNLYYTTLPGTGWKLAIQMPLSEVNAPVHKLLTSLIIICILAIIISIIVILLEVNSISRGIRRVQKFSTALAKGDFSVKPIDVNSSDELGDMSGSLNEMYDNNKGIIMKISEHAGDLGVSSKRLREASGVLNEKFRDIHKYMNEVNDAMLSTSSSTEEVNASTEEVLANINLLTKETGENKEMSKEIKQRAGKIGAECRESSDSANKLSEKFEQNLKVSIADAAIVSRISEMADVISNIAEQINLLSLNASIEAARAGEAGKGFAVVATEIGSLAGNTSEAVSKIQATIEQVQAAFDRLTNDAKDMLSFVQDTVAPDYSKFLGVAEQYGEDASRFEDSSENISEMSDNIRKIMTEVTSAIQTVSEATQETTKISQDILDSIDQVSVNVEEVNNMSENQESIANDLDSVVSQFTLG